MAHHAIQRAKPRPPKELALHKFTAQLLRLNAAPGVLFFHVPNGESRSAATGAKLKAMGVRAGVADFSITLPGGRAAYLELKRPGGRASQSQKQFRAEAEAAGALYAIAETPEQVQDILTGWGALHRRAA